MVRGAQEEHALSVFLLSRQTLRPGIQGTNTPLRLRALYAQAAVAPEYL